MTRLENRQIKVSLFNDPNDFDKFLHANGMGSGYGSRAKGKIGPDGKIFVAIDKGYYLRGGLRPAQLKAIVEHERVELTTQDPNPHLQGVMTEYKLICSRYGEKGLREYHSRLCNLMGGINDDRNLALKTVLQKQQEK